MKTGRSLYRIPLVIALVAVLLLQGTIAPEGDTRAVPASSTTLFTEDWESGIDPHVWTTWGFPLPSVYSGEGRGGSNAVNSNGDSVYASGLFVSAAFDVTQDISVEYWLRGYGPIGGLWQGGDVGLTLCEPTVNHETCGDWLALILPSAEPNVVIYQAQTEAGTQRWTETWQPLEREWHKYHSPFSKSK